MKTLSEKQLKANKQNAKLGGVKTDIGKNISKFNALKHGILRTSISEYEQLDYKMLYETLESDFPPENILEELVLERIAISYIKLLRVARAEAEYVKFSMDNQTRFNNVYANVIPHSSFSVSDFKRLVEIYSRYETATENRFYKAINKLIELHKQHEK